MKIWSEVLCFLRNTTCDGDKTFSFSESLLYTDTKQFTQIIINSYISVACWLCFIVILNFCTKSPWFHLLGDMPESKIPLSNFVIRARILSLAHLIISEMMLSRTEDLFVLSDFNCSFNLIDHEWAVQKIFIAYGYVNNFIVIRWRTLRK